MKLDIPVRKCMKLGILFVNLQFNQGGRKREKKKKKQVRATIPVTMQISFGEAE